MGGSSWKTDVGTVCGILVLLILAVAVAFRFLGLDHLPGVNGDEAYYGALMLELRAGNDPPLVTNSGLPLNPFYSGVLFLIHLVWPSPSFVILRLPALLSGLLALGLAYPLLKRALDRRIALLTTLLLACLPIAIAYSRFGWDQSQAPLASLLCLYFALRRQLLATLLALLAAIVVHPLNLALAPILLGPVTLEWLVRNVERRQRLRRLVPVGIGLVLVSIAALCGLTLLSDKYQGSEASAPGTLSRWVSPTAWGQFALAYGDLLSGTTIYRYIPGQVPDWSIWLERGVFWGLVLGLLACGLAGLIRRRDFVVLGLLAGLVTSLVGLNLSVGVAPLRPGFERYGMCLITPSCLVLALLVRSLGDSPLPWRVQLGGVLVLCGLLLGGFSQRYFGALLETGGQSERAFWTGPVEPKRAAFDYIMATAADGQPVTILAEDFWCFLPIRYLAAGRPEVRVIMSRQVAAEPDELSRSERRFVVGFADGPSAELLAKRAPHLPREAFVDYAHRPVLYVWDLGKSVELLPDLAKLPERPSGKRSQ